MLHFFFSLRVSLLSFPSLLDLVGQSSCCWITHNCCMDTIRGLDRLGFPCLFFPSWYYLLYLAVIIGSTYFFQQGHTLPGEPHEPFFPLFSFPHDFILLCMVLHKIRFVVYVSAAGDQILYRRWPQLSEGTYLSLRICCPTWGDLMSRVWSSVIRFWGHVGLQLRIRSGSHMPFVWALAAPPGSFGLLLIFHFLLFAVF